MKSQDWAIIPIQSQGNEAMIDFILTPGEVGAYPAMTIAPSETIPYASILQQVAIAGRTRSAARPGAAIVIAALLAAEKASKQRRLQFPFRSLSGEWRLCFVTGTQKRPQGGITLGKGFYLPRLGRAVIGFTPEAETSIGQISNQVQVGPLALRLTGPARYLDKKNILAFDFTQIQFCFGQMALGPLSFRGGWDTTAAFATVPIAQLPFFAFFWMTDDLIAARGRGGGLAIWIREANPASIQG